MAVDMTPTAEDSSINIPLTFDYKGGRSTSKKGKILMSLVMLGLCIIGVAGVSLMDRFDIWMKIPIILGILYVFLFFERFFVLKELYFSDIFEGLLETDYKMQVSDIWQIFDIEPEYPYICYYRNGWKGLFVRMEKDAVTGKPDDYVYIHYDAVGNAYNVCHSLNMNMIHLDYMDNVGNDIRMQGLYDQVQYMPNPDMQDMMIDIYDNLVSEMSRNYASFDVYLFLTKDNVKNFMYNVQQVANVMMGGNFITYKVMDMYEIARLCSSLLNLHEFSVLDAFDKALAGSLSVAVVPISVTHGDGTVEVINKTIAEKAKERAERERRMEEAKNAKKQRRKRSTGEVVLPDEEIDLFGSATGVATKSAPVEKVAKAANAASKAVSKAAPEDEFDLFGDSDAKDDDDIGIDLFGG